VSRDEVLLHENSAMISVLRRRRMDALANAFIRESVLTDGVNVVPMVELARAFTRDELYALIDVVAQAEDVLRHA
jgi:hypothetical protein